VDRVGIDWACCKHWAVIVEFDNRTIAYEITPFKDENCIYKITPQWSNFQNNCRFNKMIFLGATYTSPAEIRDKADKNSNNGKKYNTISNNCQNWVKELLAAMDQKLLRALNEKDIKPIKQRLAEKVGSSFQTSASQIRGKSSSSSSLSKYKLELVWQSRVEFQNFELQTCLKFNSTQLDSGLKQ
jgi:hypothetical protein